jgi:2-polyprenyl-3-methyl-5-hydroxy-6-metoxy-1,4-benzoquinol methylase
MTPTARLRDVARVQDQGLVKPRNTTLREVILGSSTGYRAFKVLTRGDQTMRAMAAEYIRPKSGERILDVGCGYGDLAQHLEGVTYVGVDINEQYIQFAQRNALGKAKYLVGDVTTMADTDLGTFDCAVLIGVLHHMSDGQATSMLHAVSGILNPGGRFVAAEPVWDPSQETTARVLAALDRGRYVRDQAHYERLVSPWFANTVSEIRSDLFWFPYTHCMINASLDH